MLRERIVPVYDAMMLAGLEEKEGSVILLLDPGRYEVDAEPLPVDVAAILVEGTFTLTMSSTPVVRREYVSPEDGTLMRVTEATFTMEGETLVLSAQEKPRDGEPPERVISIHRPGE